MTKGKIVCMYYVKQCCKEVPCTKIWQLNTGKAKNIDIWQSKFRGDPGLNIFTIPSNFCLSCKRLTRAILLKQPQNTIIEVPRYYTSGVAQLETLTAPDEIFLNGVKQQTINQSNALIGYRGSKLWSSLTINGDVNKFWHVYSTNNKHTLLMKSHTHLNRQKYPRCIPGISFPDQILRGFHSLYFGGHLEHVENY